MKTKYPIERKKIRFNFYLTRQMKERLEKISLHRSRTVTTFLTEAIEKHLADWENRIKLAEELKETTQ